MAHLKTPLEAHHHIVPIRTYALTLAALIVLMVSTVAISFVQIPDFLFITGTVMNQAAALIIACMKAALVVFIFRGVRWATQLTKFWAMLGFTWLIFFTVMAGDYTMRKYENVQGWESSPASGLPRNVGSLDHVSVPPDELNVRPRQ
jgi:caa(3)-type oxidase subunit IV